MNDQEFEDYTRSMQEMFRSTGWEYFLNDHQRKRPKRELR